MARKAKVMAKTKAKTKAKAKAKPKAKPKAVRKFELRLLQDNRWKLIKVLATETCEGFLEIWAANQGFSLGAYPGHCLRTPCWPNVIALDAVLSQVLQPRAHVYVHLPGVPISVSPNEV